MHSSRREVLSRTTNYAASMNFILLHGSFHGAWNWHDVAPLLRANGHIVNAIDLPGHGLDQTPPHRISLASNVRAVTRRLDTSTEPTVIVAHSRNGIVASQVAEARPDRLAGLVYLAAYLVPHGKTMMDYAATDTDSLVVQNVRPALSPARLRALHRVARTGLGRWLLSTLLPSHLQRHHLRQRAFREALYADCPERITALADALLTPEPNWPGFTPLHLTAQRAGRVPRVYVECTEDRAVTLQLQRRMQADSPCAKVFSLPSGHSPFFSMPAQLVSVLEQSLEVFRG